MDSRDTLERLIPEQVHDEDLAASESLELHRKRYEFAAAQAVGGSLLDMACGVGYGTRLIADRRADLSDLTGVDISPEAIRYARENYAHGASGPVGYVEHDAMTFSREGPDAGAFDSIVSLETIEHLPRPEAFFAHLVGLLRPGGMLIASVPVTPSVDLNPHHLHDFTACSFREMGERNGLVENASQTQVQRARIRDLWGADRRFRRENLRANLPAYYVSHPSAFLKRIATTLRHGLANHYLTIAWEKGGRVR